MPYDYSEDLMPRNAPKATPLIKVAATPLVPEVSLLLDQDKNKSLHLMKPSVIQSTGDKLANHFQIQDQNKILFPDQFESYNTSNKKQSKDAQVLHTSTDSLRNPEINTKHMVGSRKLNCARKKQTDGNEYINSPGSEDIVSSLHNQIPSETSTSLSNKPASEFNNNEKFTERPAHNFEQQSRIYPNKLVQHRPCTHENYSQSKDNKIHPRMRNIYELPRECQCQEQNAMIMHNPHNNMKDMYSNTCAIQKETSRPNNRNQTPNYGINNNQEHCQYRQENGRECLANEIEYASRQPTFLKEQSNNNVYQMLNSKPVSLLDIIQINHQIVMDLYHKINHKVDLLNEEMSIIKQQVKQLFQISLDCDRASIKQNEAYTNFSNDENCPPGSNSTQNKPPTPGECKDNAKRSIVIMASSTENNIDICPIANTQKKNDNSPKVKDQHQINNPSSSHQRKNPSQRDIPCNEEVKKTRYTSTPGIKSNETLKACRQVDNSFSLNEAEHEDTSPNTSNNIEEFGSSSPESDERDTMESSGDESNAVESGTEYESSFPQFGWTYYNQCVGQIQNMLMKTTPPRVQPQIPRRKHANFMCDMNKTYETENNWSKRVIYDGLPLEDNDNPPNMMHMPIFNQDFRTNNVPDRMQDFMMDNIPNSHTNISISTLRCLEQYNLPTLHALNMPREHAFQGYQKNDKQNKKKKKKSRNF